MTSESVVRDKGPFDSISEVNYCQEEITPQWPHPRIEPATPGL